MITVTGGSRGLGRALVGHLAESQVIFTFSRTPSGFIHANVHEAGIDVTGNWDAGKMGYYLRKSAGLVNNIGMAHDGLLATQTDGQIAEMIDTNLTATIRITKLYIRERLAQGLGGSVVFISSVCSIRGYAGLAVYAATKGALNSLTQALAREYGSKGFRFNAVLPGYFESDLSASLSDEKRRRIIRRTPLGRLATPADICPLVEFLLSDDAGFITGQLIAVDGGLTV
jgi:3-oxoacyl-[acyl-carrier protein] reductase